MIEVDRAMIEDYQIDLIQMMENAGRNLAHLARIRFLEGHPLGKTIVILAGSGGNGGGAMVCARRLHNYGAKVIVIISKEFESFTGVPGHQLEILRKMNLPILELSGDSISLPVEDPHLIIDGLIGYSLERTTTGNGRHLDSLG